MEIKAENYAVWFEQESNTLTFTGTLRLSGMEEYEPIMQLLNDVAERSPTLITLNLQDLKFLNSSGINVLSKFVIKIRQLGNIQVVVRGSENTPWQAKSLRNLQRLMPGLSVEFD